jgi:hypothetical protein
MIMVEELLHLHQLKLMMCRNLPDEYDFTIIRKYTVIFIQRYSFFELIYHWIRLKLLDPTKIMKEMTQRIFEYYNNMN